ncbi:MAG: LysE family translocator [Salinisphaera sp.]|nr:LysE family translocator [Salinisphaera sp.]
MLTDFWIPLTIFAVVAAFTPGPNNLMLAASGMNYGFRRSVPHMIGVTVGFPVMLLCVIFGVGAIIAGLPILREAVQALAAGFIVYFAWKIATAKTDLSADGAGRPLTLWQAALFQWVNPKGWAVAIAVASLYAPGGVRDWDKALYMALLFLTVTCACTSCWTSLGTVIEHALQEPKVRRWINRGMAVALVLTMLPILVKSLGD